MVYSSKSSQYLQLTSHILLKRILLSVYRHNLHWTLIKKNGLVLITIASEVHHLQTCKGHLAPSPEHPCLPNCSRIPWGSEQSIHSKQKGLDLTAVITQHANWLHLGSTKDLISFDAQPGLTIRKPYCVGRHMQR